MYLYSWAQFHRDSHSHKGVGTQGQVVPPCLLHETFLYEVTHKHICPCYDFIINSNPLASEALTGTKHWNDWEERREEISLIFSICMKI